MDNVVIQLLWIICEVNTYKSLDCK